MRGGGGTRRRGGKRRGERGEGPARRELGRQVQADRRPPLVAPPMHHNSNGSNDKSDGDDGDDDRDD